jgi:hypothetical protein
MKIMDLITKQRNIDRKYERLRGEKEKYGTENLCLVLHPSEIQA